MDGMKHLALPDTQSAVHCSWTISALHSAYAEDSNIPLAVIRDVCDDAVQTTALP